MPSSSQARRLLTLGGIALGVTLANGVGCNGGAVGVDACIAIEQARCGLAIKCAGQNGTVPSAWSVPNYKWTATEVANCKTLYRDHCRVGIENNTIKDPAKDQYDACVAALTAVATCGFPAAKGGEGLPSMLGCLENGTQVAVDDFSLLPCYVFANPEHLTACSFIEAPPTSTTAAATTAATTGATTAATTTSSTTGAGGAGG
jgi:hypothetical protein